MNGVILQPLGHLKSHCVQPQPCKTLVGSDQDAAPGAQAEDKGLAS